MTDLATVRKGFGPVSSGTVVRILDTHKKSKTCTVSFLTPPEGKFLELLSKCDWFDRGNQTFVVDLNQLQLVRKSKRTAQ